MNKIDHQKKILIIEDNDTLRNLLYSWLTELLPECDFHIVQTGEKGLAYAKLVKPHIVVVDIKLPGMDGLQVTKEIKKYDCECEVIVLTIFDGINYQRDAYNAGARSFINKKDMHIKLPLEIISILELQRD